MNGQTRSPGVASAQPVVRRAGPEDAGLIAGFNRAMARETEGRELAGRAARDGVAAVMADPAHGFYAVAELGGQVVGSLLVTFEWSDWRNARFWWIQSVYVVPDARRGGVYRALHGYVHREALAHGACGLRLYVEADNRTAQVVYESMGMQASHYRIYEQEFQNP
jgi:GNAT superfamily N-acetyltransferase